MESHCKKNRKRKTKWVQLPLEERIAFFNKESLTDGKSREALQLLLMDWFDDLEGERRETVKFTSRIIEAQVKLKEAMQITRVLATPNKFTTALCSNLLGSLCPSFGTYKDIMFDVHDLLFQLVYDPVSKHPYFDLTNETEESIKKLRKERAEFMQRQHRLKEEQMKSDELFDSTVLKLQVGVLRRSFQAWKDLAQLRKNHLKNLQHLFSRWWRGEDLVKWCFHEWQSYTEERIKKRLLDDLEQGSMDLAYHERLIQDKERKLQKNRLLLKQLEEAYEAKFAAIKEREGALEEERACTEDTKQYVENMEALIKKLQQLSESIGSNVIKNYLGQLKVYMSSPDARALAERVNNNEEDYVLAWLKIVLGKLYERDSSKRMLLQGAKTVTKVVELGLVLDLVNCISPESRPAMEQVSDESILLNYVDVDLYNKTHVDAIKDLCKLFASNNKDNKSAHSKRERKSTIGTGAVARDLSAMERSPGISDTITMTLHQQETIAEGFPPGAARRTRRKSIMAMVYEDPARHLEGTDPLQNTVQELGQEEDNFWLDESLPIVSVEELLDAVDPDGEHDSLFLDSFLRASMIANPFLPSQLSDSADSINALQSFKNEFARITDQTFLYPRHLRPKEEPVVDVSRAHELQTMVQQARLKWASIHDLERKYLDNLKRENVWPALQVSVEQSMWRSLSRAGAKASSSTENKEPSIFLEFLEELNSDNRSESDVNVSQRQRHHQFNFQSLVISKHEILEAVEFVMAKRYGGDKSSWSKTGDDTEEYNPLEYLEKAIGELLCAHADILSVVLKRYSISGSVLDILKECRLLDLDKFSNKKVKPKLQELSEIVGGNPLKTEHVVEALLFVTERYQDGKIDETFIKTFETHVLKKIASNAQLVQKEIYVFKKKQVQALRFVFEKFQTKGSPVGHLSMTNWRNLLDHRKNVVDSSSLTRPRMLELFERCNACFAPSSSHAMGEKNNSGKQPSSALCFTEFLDLVTKIAAVKFPSPLQPLGQKLDKVVAQMTVKKE